MIVCVSVGAVNSVCWLAWSAWNWRVRPKAARAASIAVLALLVTTLLELLDFPPVGWALDSHALWHAATAPIHLAWYTFAINDCRQSDEEHKKRSVEMAAKKDA